MTIFVQILYFLAVMAIMVGAGIWLMFPPLKRGDRELLLVRMLISLAVKLVAGIGFLLLAWKGFGWSTMLSSLGMVMAYLAALITIALIAQRMVKQTVVQRQVLATEDTEKHGN